MARHFTDSNGNVLIVPDSSLNINVVTNPTGLASTGVIALVGEADMGPHWSEEAKLADNSFGPGDLALVTSKYGSGRLVDAFRGMLGASNSPRIQGSFQRAILVKTNQSSKASRATADGHGTIQAKLAGSKGNQIKETISTSADEVAPTTGAFSYIPSASASSMAVRVNGAAKQAIAISANMSPAALAAAITAASNLNAVGGVDRVVTSGLSASNSVDVSVSGQSASITLASPAVWGASPVAGDTLHIASGSVIAGAGNANVGWYVVTSASNSTTLAKIVATKITAGAPVAVSSVSLSATPANDLAVSSSMTINNMSGTDRAALAGLTGQTAVISAAGSALTMTLSGSNVFAASAKIGDLMHIPSGSAFVGAGSANAGWYQVTAVSNFAGAAFITASRLSNGSPVAVSSTAIAATSDIQILAKQIKGSGKSLEIADNAGAVSINTVMLGLASTSAASWLSTALTSAAELKKRIDLAKSSPLVTESFIHGGNIVLKLGYTGTSATATIATVSGAKMLTTSVVGGNGANLSINLSAVSTMADLIDMLNAQQDTLLQSELLLIYKKPLL
jgi:NOL1/NOP2/fmu family ribosome biogenesis protein